MSSSKKSTASTTTVNTTNKAVTLQDNQEVQVIEGSGNVIQQLDGGAVAGALGFAGDTIQVIEGIFERLAEEQSKQQETALKFAGSASENALKLAYDNVNPQIANAEQTNKTLIYVMGLVAVVMFVGFGGLKKIGVN